MSTHRKDKRPLIPCHHCQGKGILPLSDDMWRTLLAVHALAGADAKTVHGYLGDQVSLTAINNRLEDLRHLGLLKRERVSLRFVYTRASAPA